MTYFKGYQPLTGGAAVTANGNYPSAAGITTDVTRFTVFLAGDIGTATLTLQALDQHGDGTTWTTIQNGVWTTSTEIRNLELAQHSKVRLVISSVTTGTSIWGNLQFLLP